MEQVETKVDVLAVMDSVACARDFNRKMLRAIRHRSGLWVEHRNARNFWMRAARRDRAALARVGGGK